MACGIENTEDLIADLKQALGVMSQAEFTSFALRAIHVGNAPDPQTGAVVPPMHLASTYVQPGAGEWGEFDYSRSGNPTRTAVQETLASLEGGCGALAFSSGMAATHCATMLLTAGDHFIAGMDIYGGSYRLFHQDLFLGRNRSQPGGLARSRRSHRRCSAEHQNAVAGRHRQSRLTIPDLPAWLDWRTRMTTGRASTTHLPRRP